MANAMKCGFCLRKVEDMEDPKVLPCTHTHCFCCVSAYFDINHTVKCPQPACGCLCDTPVSALPSLNNNKKETTNLCETCLTNNALVYCLDCSRRFCTNHQQAHEQLLPGHNVIKINEYREKAVKLEKRNCEKHKNQTYSMACRTCLIVICVSCTSQLGNCHDGYSHELYPLDELVRRLLQHGLKSNLISKELKLEKLFKETSKACADYDSKTADMIQLLHITRDEQLKAIRQKYDLLEEKLTNMRQMRKARMTEHMEETVSSSWTRLRNCRLKIENKLKFSHQVDIIKEYTKIKKEIQKLINEELPKLQEEITVELQSNGRKRDVELKLVPDEKDIAEVLPKVPTLLASPKSITMLKYVNTPSPITACHSNGYTYVGLGNNTIAMINPSYQQQESFISGCGGVHSIATYRQKVYTLDTGNEVRVFNILGGYLTGWSSAGSAIAIVSDKIIAAEPQNKRLAVCSLTGQVHKYIDCNLLAHGPIALCAVDNTSVIMCQHHSSQVFRVNINNGEVMWVSRYVSHPVSVACYNNKYVIVAAFTSAILQTLDVETGNAVTQLKDKALVGHSMVGLGVFGSTLMVANFDKGQVVFYQMSC